MRSLSLSKLSDSSLTPDDFLDFGIDLEEMSLSSGNIKALKNNAFKYVHGLKHLDLSDNAIGTIENNAFQDVSVCYEISEIKMNRIQIHLV